MFRFPNASFLKKMADEIRTLSNQIDAAKLLLAKGPEAWSEEETSMFGSHNELRATKKQLRELLILKKKRNFTFENLLNSQLPTLSNLESTTDNKTGTVPTYPRDCGRGLETWDSFAQDVDDFCRSSIVTDVLATHLDPISFNEQACRNELEVQDRILNNFGVPLKALLKF
jgi:hypothetical protein